MNSVASPDGHSCDYRLEGLLLNSWVGATTNLLAPVNHAILTYTGELVSTLLARRWLLRLFGTCHDHLPALGQPPQHLPVEVIALECGAHPLEESPVHHTPPGAPRRVHLGRTQVAQHVRLPLVQPLRACGASRERWPIT
eukprot:1193554-Prorocentrum_minimum.AAC.1